MNATPWGCLPGSRAHIIELPSREGKGMPSGFDLRTERGYIAEGIGGALVGERRGKKWRSALDGLTSISDSGNQRSCP